MGSGDVIVWRDLFPTFVETALPKGGLNQMMKHGKRKQTESCFDVTMESFDSAEVCKLVGIYLHVVFFSETNRGLNRDD